MKASITDARRWLKASLNAVSRMVRDLPAISRRAVREIRSGCLDRVRGLDQGLRFGRGLKPACIALEQNQPQRMFQRFDPPRHGRLGHSKAFGCSQGRSGTHHRQKHPHIRPVAKIALHF